MKKAFVSFSLFFFMLISRASAEGQENPNLLDLPEQVGEALGIGTFAGGLLCSAFALFVPLLPLLLLSKGKNIIASLFLGVLIMSFCVAIGWLPIFTLVVAIILGAAMIATKIKDVFT